MARPLCLMVVLATCVCAARGSVILQTGNFSYDAISDIPADFGPRVPPEGVKGLLMVVEPEDACEAVAVPVVGQPWIALVVRSQEKFKNCTFDVKVSNVEAAGAVAAIIYDDVYEPLIIMSKPVDHPDPGIPAVFVSQRSGVMMKRLMVAGVTTVEITPISDAIWLSMLMSAFAGFLAMSVVMGTFFFIRHQRGLDIGGGGGQGGAAGYGFIRPAPRTMTQEQIRALPVEVYCEGAQHAQRGGGAGAGAVGAVAHYGRDEGSSVAAGSGDERDDSAHSGRKGGGTRHTCAICLESYVEGDKLRVLPCQHRYHTECIDQWLSSRKAVCPACRHDPTERDVEAGGTQVSGPSSVPARGMWALLGGRWLLWRYQAIRAARAARRTGALDTAAPSEEQQRLISPSPEPSPSAAPEQEGQEGQAQGESSGTGAVGAGGLRGLAVASAGVTGAAWGSERRHGSGPRAGEAQPEITPEFSEPSGGLPPAAPARRAPPRRVRLPAASGQPSLATTSSDAGSRRPAEPTGIARPAGAAAAGAADASRSGGRNGGGSSPSAAAGTATSSWQHSHPAGAAWLVESMADSSTEGSEG